METLRQSTPCQLHIHLDTFKDIWRQKIKPDKDVQMQYLDTFKDIWRRSPPMPTLNVRMIQIPSRIYGDVSPIQNIAFPETIQIPSRIYGDSDGSTIWSSADFIQIPSRIYGDELGSGKLNVQGIFRYLQGYMETPKIGLITSNYSRLQSILSKESGYLYRRAVMMRISLGPDDVLKAFQIKKN